MVAYGAITYLYTNKEDTCPTNLVASILSLIYSVEKNCKEMILFYVNAAGLGLLTCIILEASRFLMRRSLASPMYSGLIM